MTLARDGCARGAGRGGIVYFTLTPRPPPRFSSFALVDCVSRRPLETLKKAQDTKHKYTRHKYTNTQIHSHVAAPRLYYEPQLEPRNGGVYIGGSLSLERWRLCDGCRRAVRRTRAVAAVAPRPRTADSEACATVKGPARVGGATAARTSAPGAPRSPNADARSAVTPFRGTPESAER